MYETSKRRIKIFDKLIFCHVSFCIYNLKKTFGHQSRKILANIFKTLFTENFLNAVNFGKVLAFYFSWFYTNSQLGLGQDCFPTNPAPVHSYHLSISLPILTSGKEWSLVEKCWFCEFASSWADGLVGCSYTELYSW